MMTIQVLSSTPDDFSVRLVNWIYTTKSLSFDPFFGLAGKIRPTIRDSFKSIACVGQLDNPAQQLIQRLWFIEGVFKPLVNRRALVGQESTQTPHPWHISSLTDDFIHTNGSTAPRAIDDNTADLPPFFPRLRSGLIFSAALPQPLFPPSRQSPVRHHPPIVSCGFFPVSD